jgi:hypothetical protein
LKEKLAFCDFVPQNFPIEINRQIGIESGRGALRNIEASVQILPEFGVSSAITV